MHPVGRSGMLINYIMMCASHGSDSFHPISKQWKVLAKLNPRNRCLDGIVIGTRPFRFWITLGLGIKRIDLPHATSQPDGNNMLSLPLDRWFIGETPQRHAGNRQSSTG
jgi:hypothetical protein